MFGSMTWVIDHNSLGDILTHIQLLHIQKISHFRFLKVGDFYAVNMQNGKGSCHSIGKISPDIE